MITKDEMKNLMMTMADYLKSFGLSDEDILGAVTLMKANAVRNGTYKEEPSKESN